MRPLIVSYRTMKTLLPVLLSGLFVGSASADFELVLLTSDTHEGAMEFTKELKDPGTGIPNLVLSDLNGTLIKGN